MDTAQLLAQAGVEHSSPRLASTYEQAVDIAHHVGFPLVCKPDVPRQHFAARIATDLGQLATAFAAASEAFQVGTGGVVEPFLQGIEATAYTYSTSGRSHIVAISHATFDPQAEPALVPIELVVDGGDVCVGAVEDIALQALQAVGHHNGPAQLRLRLTATGPRVISIARQLPDPLVCLLIEEATGTDIISAAATHCRDRTMNLSGTPQGAAAIRYLQLTASVAAEPAADQNVTGHATPFAYVTRYHAGRQVGPVLRYGYVHVIGADYPQSIARLRSSVSDLRPARATA
ncbi:hypothetical protein OIE69_44270 (plasmid) [Actinacidiphila glaucinigra]|uniref:hypothetical protein n=1 Tax=Actinacidiphila glaucinigra TaxID=235986 RepID=UPI002DD80924|nr:hypothetical protein [Actinacidiphila glaucinigra]WSD65921.1 hypothetical protein OIE69_44270 [Actinacidiphila glaucinigra]